MQKYLCGHFDFGEEAEGIWPGPVNEVDEDRASCLQEPTFAPDGLGGSIHHGFYYTL